MKKNIRNILIITILAVLIINTSFELFGRTKIFQTMVEKTETILTLKQYYMLGPSQKDIFTEVMNNQQIYVKNSCRTPLFATLLKDDKLNFIVSSIYLSEEDIYKVQIDYKWSSETNVNRDEFIVAFDFDQWITELPSECTLYSASESTTFNSPSSAIFGGEIYVLKGRRNISGTIIAGVKPTKENADKKILVAISITTTSCLSALILKYPAFRSIR